MNIDKIQLEISAAEGSSTELSNFGFTFNFEDKLNLLTGHNSSGKSTVLSCIYYCLGLEQLIGSKGPKTLSPAIREKFTYQSKSYNVIESNCKLSITANNGIQYVLTRGIKDPETQNSLCKEIIIEEGDNRFSKFVHAIRDHDEHGFYRWLADVNLLTIPEKDNGNGNISKYLYMQNIFSLSFIEQTKGWSDFFSMLPSFGIKDVKQKIVEYCLDLNSLESRIKLDEILSHKDEIKKSWKNVVEKIESKTGQLNFNIPNINSSTIIKDKKIKSVKPFILLNNEEKTLDTHIINLNKQINDLDKKIDDSARGIIISGDQLADKEKLINIVRKYEKEHKNILELMNEEESKLKKYKDTLNEITYDLKDFQDIKWLSEERTWSKIANSNCPVCEQNLIDISTTEISTEKVQKTANFLKSQKELYSSYLYAGNAAVEKYRAALNFYSIKLNSKKAELNLLTKDISSPSILAIRSEMQRLAELNQRKYSLDEFIEYFKVQQTELMKLSQKYYIYIEQEKEIKTLLKLDESTVTKFESAFVSLLNKFGYKSNGTKNIKIENKGNYPLIPQVSLWQQESQNIRFISSASDFVRAIWSYYLSLLTIGKKHPGFLVLDEPGQHQMRLDSLVELLKLSSKSGKQVIMAVSQDRKYDDKKVNIKELTEQLDVSEYNLLHISDGEGCVTAR